MAMNVNLERLVPPAGQLSIDIRVSTSINVTAFSARQKVTGFVVDEISTNMHGGEPSLAVRDRVYWSVPVILSLPPTGDLGEVGVVDVDVETGQLVINTALIQEIMRRGEDFALRSASETATA